MKIDIWMHHHRHGTDPYLMCRHDDEPTHSVDEVIEQHSIDFESDREDEYIELQVTTLDAPCPFTIRDIGDLQFGVRAQRNRVKRQLKKMSPGDNYYDKNKSKLERYEALLNVLEQQEKYIVSPRENVPGS